VTAEPPWGYWIGDSLSDRSRTFGTKRLNGEVAIGRFGAKRAHHGSLTGWVGSTFPMRDCSCVPPAPRIPTQLAKRPFTLEEAEAAGLTLSALKGKSWRRLGSALYCSSRSSLDPWSVLAAWRRRLPRESTFAGATAAWMHGLDFEPTNPVEVIVATESTLRSRAGLTARRCVLTSRERTLLKGLPATTLTRTLLDFCLTRPPVEALVAIDMAVQRGLLDAVRLAGFANSQDGKAGVNRLRFLSSFAEPAESPMETRLRWLLLSAGLPRPQVQFDLHDSAGQFLARADLFYAIARLVIEFDGANHRVRLVSDDRRQNLLTNAGYRVLRFTTADVKGRPDDVVAQVRGALAMASTARLAPNGPFPTR